MRGSLITVDGLAVNEVAAILDLTSRLEKMAAGEKAKLLAGRRIALLFYESSTRTRTSFELAAKALGATTTLVSDKSSSIEKGESLKDTGLTLRALGAGMHRAAAPGERRSVCAGACDRAAGAERRRRNASASVPGFAGFEDHHLAAEAEGAAGGCGTAAWGDGCDYGRHTAQPGGAIECDAAADAWSEGAAVWADGVAA